MGFQDIMSETAVQAQREKSAASCYDLLKALVLNHPEHAPAEIKQKWLSALADKSVVKRWTPPPIEKEPRDDFLPEIEYAPTIPLIVRMTASYYGLSVNDVVGDRRKANIAMARHVAMYLSRTLTRGSFPYIGKRFYRDHTSVLHAVQRINRLRIEDRKLDQDIETLTSHLVIREVTTAQ